MVSYPFSVPRREADGNGNSPFKGVCPYVVAFGRAHERGKRSLVLFTVDAERGVVVLQCP